MLEPLAQRADYDPQASAISSAYVAAFNEYVRKTLGYGEDKTFRPRLTTFRTWNWQHQQPGQAQSGTTALGFNVMPTSPMR